MTEFLNYISKRKKTFLIIGAVTEFIIYLVAGIEYCFVSVDDEFKFVFIALMIFALVYPAKLVFEALNVQKKLFRDITAIITISIGIFMIVAAFIGMLIGRGTAIFILISSILFVLTIIAEFICLDIIKNRNPITAIIFHSLSCVLLTVNIMFMVGGNGVPVIFWVTSTLQLLEIVYYAFVYTAVSRWDCPACHKINKNKAKFCVGCGLPRPAAPISAKTPAPISTNMPAPMPANIPTPMPANMPAPMPANTPAPISAKIPAPMPVKIAPGTPAPNNFQAFAPVPPAPAPQAGVKFCRNCGFQLLPGVHFCEQCGRPVK